MKNPSPHRLDDCLNGLLVVAVFVLLLVVNLDVLQGAVLGRGEPPVGPVLAQRAAAAAVARASVPHTVVAADAAVPATAPAR